MIYYFVVLLIKIDGINVENDLLLSISLFFFIQNVQIAEFKINQKKKKNDSSYLFYTIIILFFPFFQNLFQIF